jgi:uncharacterized membrane protein
LKDIKNAFCFFNPQSEIRIPQFCIVPAAIEQYVPQVAPARVCVRVWLVWGACVALTSAWLSLILGAPLLRARGHEALALLAYRVFAALCHQIPERSFYLAGQPLAVCARCFGIYAGFALGVVCYPLVRSLRRTDTPARRWLLFAALPTGVDFALGFTGLWANTHTSRALTGALLGAVAALYVVPGLVAFGLYIEGRAQARTKILTTSFDKPFSKGGKTA